jgi:hypothetical protein
MRVEIFTASDARELTSELNAVLEGYNNEEVEIQYQHCATRTGDGWSRFFSAMVIFK